MGEKPILTVLKAEGHSADTGAGKFPLVLMGGRAEGLACADPERGPPSALTEIFNKYYYLVLYDEIWFYCYPPTNTIAWCNSVYSVLTISIIGWPL